jgi:hypothetical protein
VAAAGFGGNEDDASEKEEYAGASKYPDHDEHENRSCGESEVEGENEDEHADDYECEYDLGHEFRDECEAKYKLLTQR